MRGLLTTQSQNGYREQIHKEMLTRLAWKSRYARLYPSCQQQEEEPQPSQPAAPPPPAPPAPPAPPPPPAPPAPPRRGAAPPPPPSQDDAPPLMRPVSPQTRQALYQDSSHHGRGRRLYLQRRGNIRPEEKFDFPLLSSWDYGWRLGDFTLNYKTPSSAKSSVVRNTFYAKNGVFSGSDQLG